MFRRLWGRMNCAELESFLFPYLDGEFDFTERADFERHLAECASCGKRIADQVRLHQSFRGALRRASESTTPAPIALRQKIVTELSADLPLVPGRWLATAAAVAVVAVGSSYMVRPRLRQRLAADAAIRHAKSLPSEVQEGSNEVVEAWFGGKLDHRVPVPYFPNSHVTGARISHVTDKTAAYIAYEQPDRHGGASRRMGLFVFDDANRDVDAETIPSVQESHGYNVAFWREGEIVYELVSDLDEQDIRSLLEAKSRWAKTDESRSPRDQHSLPRDPPAPFQTPSPTIPASFIPASLQQ